MRVESRFAQRLRGGFAFLKVARAENDGEILRGQLARGFESQAAIGAGDECNFHDVWEIGQSRIEKLGACFPGHGLAEVRRGAVWFIV